MEGVQDSWLWERDSRKGQRPKSARKPAGSSFLSGCGGWLGGWGRAEEDSTVNLAPLESY